MRGVSCARIAIRCVVLTIIICGCRSAGQLKKPAVEESTPPSSGPTPRVITSADGQQGKNWGQVEIASDGRARMKLVLGLDYFPDPRPGSATLPGCLPPLPEDWDLGLAVCEGATGVSQKQIVVANVEQACFTNPSYQRVAATRPLELKGCTKVRLMGHVFDPELQMDFEPR